MSFYRILLVFFCWQFLFLSSQSIASDLSFQIETIGVESGLPQSTVRDITQDKYGFMYFATDEGVSRYDGVSHQVLYRNSDDKRILFSFSELCIHQETLWATSLDGGVLRYDIALDYWQQISLQELAGDNSGKHVLGCEVDASGNIWFTSEEGLIRVDDGSSVNGKDSFYPLNNLSQSDELITDFLIDKNNQIFVATTKGLKGFAQGRFYIFESLMLDKKPVTSITLDQQSRIWLLQDDRFLAYVKSDSEWNLIEEPLLKSINQAIAGNQPSSIKQTRDGAYWITSKTSGMWMMPKGTNTLYHLKGEDSDFAITDKHIASVFQSKDGIIWLGTWLNGVAKLTPGARGLTTYSKFETENGVLDEPSIRSIFRDSRDRFWVGTDGSGILRGNDLKGTMRLFNTESEFNYKLPSDFVRVVYETQNGQILIGTEAGLVQFDEQLGFQYLELNGRGELTTGALIRDVFEDRNGRIWVGTYDKGLFWWDADKSRFYPLPLSQSRAVERVTTIRPDHHGRLWVGTDTSGVFILDPDTRSVEKHLHANLGERLSVPGNSIWSIYPENDTSLWLGSYGRGIGKLNLNSNVFQYFTVKDGLPNDVIYSILQDDKGWLWSTTNRGLTRYLPDEGHFISYFKVHGLPHNEFNSGAYFKDEANQTFYFGSLRGLVEIQSDSINRDIASHRVYLNDLKVNGESIEVSTQDYQLNGPIYRLNRLKAYNHYERLSFTFTTNDYYAPEKSVFSYRLVGFNDQWQTTEPNVRRVSFNSLAAGDYRLEVKARNSYGSWSEDILRIDIELMPPWWLTGWAYIFYLVSLFVFIWMLIEGWSRYQRRNREMVERLHYLVKHRTQELKSKNEQLSELNAELQQANEKLERVSMTDALTGLGNRRLLYQYLERDVGNVNRAYISVNPDFSNLEEVQKNDLIFFIIDIDNFKQINDNYGHAIGDKVLIEVTNVVSKIIRQGDYVIRYGGEEFLFVMRETHRNEAPIIAERILHAFMEHKFPISSELTLSLTCSVGFAPYPFSSYYPSQLLPEQIIQIADLCLYCAKSSGKNCWVGLEGLYWEKEVDISEVIKSPEEVINNGLVKVYSAKALDELVWSSRDQ